MRADGRQAGEARAISITPDYLPMAEGSALIAVGHTKVLCTASVEETVPGWLKGAGRGWVTAEYAMLPRATTTRTQREGRRGGSISGRTQEIQRLIGRSLRAATDLEALGERSIVVDCDVIQADGGTRTASISGGFVALALALKQLHAHEQIPAIPLFGYLAAISVGVVNGEPVLDLNYEEDSAAHVDMNVVMNGAGEFVELQATAEGKTFSGDALTQLLELGRNGVDEMIAAQRAVVSW